jgi:hypothetical protein
VCHPTCVSWSNADLSGSPERDQSASCGTFFANLCSNDANAIQSLLDLPPAAPPPPFPPDASLEPLSVVAVRASGGFYGHHPGDYGERTPVDALGACVGTGLGSPCITAGKERPWLMFDLGETKTIFSARLHFLPPAPPLPPAEPPTSPPSPPPSPDPPPPPSPSPSPPPPTGTPPFTETQRTICVENGDNNRCVRGLINFTHDGVCDDGGVGSLFAHCEFASDLHDCGPRCYKLSPPAPPNSPSPPHYTLFDPPTLDELGIPYFGRRLATDASESRPLPVVLERIHSCFRNNQMFGGLGDVDRCIDARFGSRLDTNGVCDDGGEGSQYAYCAFGTDFTDCGARCLGVLAAENAERALNEACNSVGDVERDDCVVDGVDQTKNGVCQDGSLFDARVLGNQSLVGRGDCGLLMDGSDCATCARQYGRDPSGRARGSMGREGDHAGGDGGGTRSVEFWVSRSFASFGTRAAVIRSSSEDAGSSRVALLTEGADGVSAEGRFVYVRSFASGTRLRVEAVQLFALPETRAESRRELEQGREDEDDSQELYARELLRNVSSWKRVLEMRNLTSAACDAARSGDRALAAATRARASVRWVGLSEREANYSCTDCSTRVAGNCTFWFAVNNRGEGGRRSRDERKLKEHIEETADERRRALHESMGRACCRTNRATGEQECDVKHCKEAMRRKAHPRVAHVLRKLHESPTAPVALSVAQLVATDMLAPHLHADESCRDSSTRRRGDVECLASSLSQHLAAKHGFSRSAIDEQLGAYGLSLSKILTAHLRHTTPNGPGRPSQRVPRARRDPTTPRKSHSKDKERRAAGPRASWVSRSTRRQRALRTESEDTTPTIRVEIAPEGRADRASREAYQWAKNHSDAARALLRLRDRAAIRAGQRAPTTASSVSDAWSSMLTSKSSLVGRARGAVVGLRAATERAEEARSLLARALEPRANAGDTRRRELGKAERQTFDEVEWLLQNHSTPTSSGRAAGLQLPKKHLDEYGWITESFDWAYWYDEALRVGRALYARHAAIRAHADATGALPTGDLQEAHRTGYWWMDINAPPTRLGEAVRSLVPLPVEFASRLRGRRANLHWLPRAGAGARAAPVAESSMLRAVWQAVSSGADAEWVFRVARGALQEGDHRTSGRRLFDMSEFVGEYVVRNTAYFARAVFGNATHALPGDASKDPLREVGRYIVYDMFLCYLYPPPSRPGESMGDGTGIQLHYGDKACFPMINSVPGKMPTFNEYYGLGDNFQWRELEYENACNSDAVRAMIGPMSSNLATIDFFAAPYGSLLRVAEGVDSVRNLASRARAANATDAQRASAVVCGLTQLGGVVWTAIVAITLLLFCACSQLWTVACLGCFRRACSNRAKARERALAARRSITMFQRTMNRKIARATLQRRYERVEKLEKPETEQRRSERVARPDDEGTPLVALRVPIGR